MLDVYPIRLRFIFGCLLVSAPPLFKRHRFSASGNPCRKRKNSGKELLLFLFLAFLADCCILFTITIKKTKCSTALSASIFLSLLFCLSGVFPLGRFKNRRCFTCGKKDFRFNRCPKHYRPYFCLLLIYGRNSSCEKESVF